MTVFALVFVLLFIMLIVGGILLNLYLYAHGAFNRGTGRRIRARRLGAASFSQTGTVPILESAPDLYYGGAGVRYTNSMSAYSRKLLLYGLGFIVSLVVLAVLVLGATQF